jgi:imidazole glycerol phosphate synthase subunit HisF
LEQLDAGEIVLTAMDGDGAHKSCDRSLARIGGHALPPRVLVTQP